MHIIWRNEICLPLIDIFEFLLDLEREPNNLQNHESVSRVKEACKEWGMFRLVNHGIPQNLLQKVKSVSHQLFFEPEEAKERAATCNAKNGYTKFPTNKVLVFNDLPISNLMPKVCKKYDPCPMKKHQQYGMYYFQYPSMMRNVCFKLIVLFLFL